MATIPVFVFSPIELQVYFTSLALEGKAFFEKSFTRDCSRKEGTSRHSVFNHYWFCFYSFTPNQGQSDFGRYLQGKIAKIFHKPTAFFVEEQK